jgi:hypothetical protein
VAELPEIPRGQFLEDAVAAALQGARFYIERSVHESQEGTVTLELDIIASRYDPPANRSFLAEIKSGGWGFGDIFKLAGWMRFLGMPESVFFATTPPEERKMQRMEAVCKQLNIKLAVCPRYTHKDLVNALTMCECVPEPAQVDETSVDLWRWTFALDRYLVLAAKRARNDGSVVARRIVEYHSLINDRLFFVEKNRKKVVDLYNSFGEYGTISQDAAHEVDPYNARSVLDTELRFGEHDTVQAALALLYRGRLGVLKAAVDLLLEPGDLDARLKTIGFYTLPITFRNGIAELRNHKFVHLYPHFWQLFLWQWGGFVLLDHREEEYSALSQATGIEAAEIPNALTAFDLLLPTAGSWFRDIFGEIRIMKLYPSAFRGIGSFRRLADLEPREYFQLGLGQFATGALVEWHNSTVKFLDRALPVLEAEG